MEEILNQIIQIDSSALIAKQKNEELIKFKQDQYEEKIKKYRDEVIQKANERAEELYKQIIENGMKQYQIEEEKNKQVELAMKNRYLQIEEKLLEQLFNEIFVTEG